VAIAAKHSVRPAVVGNEDGWMIFDASVRDVEAVWAQAVEWEESYKAWLAAQRAAKRLFT